MREYASMKPTLAARTQKNFKPTLLKWFRTHQRDLPWRSSRDPYRIWVAEVMLQQTRIAAVMPYYQRFLDRFPNFESLAQAPQTEVLKLWSGLGYYSRARNLHAAAKEIVAHHEGKLPRELDAALALPGIGTYTAAAVLSIAYDVPLAVLDGNVARVLARIHAIRGDLRAPKTWRALSEIANHQLAKNSASDWNQSLMELGEVICTPQSPRCDSCPVAHWCRAYAENLTNEIPSSRRKRAPVHMKIAAAILVDPRGRTLLLKDPGDHDGVLFSRMWQFPAVEVTSEPKAALAAHLRAFLSLPANASPLELEALPAASHGVTFRNITLLPFLARIKQLPTLPRTRIIPLKNLAKLPISSATKKIAARALASGVLMFDAKITSDHGKEASAGPLARGFLHPSPNRKPRKSATSR
jgi:A/G-specific adenine glycosylase